MICRRWWSPTTEVPRRCPPGNFSFPPHNPSRTPPAFTSSYLFPPFKEGEGGVIRNHSWSGRARLRLSPCFPRSLTLGTKRRHSSLTATEAFTGNNLATWQSDAATLTTVSLTTPAASSEPWIRPRPTDPVLRRRTPRRRSTHPTDLRGRQHHRISTGGVRQSSPHPHQ